MKTTTVLLLSFLVYIQCYSQTFTNYTTADGLVDNSVLCVTIDNNGDLWFGTQNGISKYNGTTWETHDMTTDSGLVNNTITSICALANGDLWIGTDFGACVYNGTYWTSYTTADGLGDDRVIHIEEAPDGKIWFGEYDGLSIFDGTNWTSYNMSDGLPFGGIKHIEFESNGDAWLGSGFGGFIHFDGSNFTIYNSADGLLNNIVNSVAIDDQNKKWVGTATGISVFNNSNTLVTNHTQMYILPPPDTLNPVIDVEFDSQGLLWAGIYVDYLLDGGVAMYNGFCWVDFNASDGLIGPVITDLVIDSLDQVWITTSSGISKLANVPASTNFYQTNNYTIFPNPTIDEITIESKSKDNINYIVKNMTGKTVQKGLINNDLTRININGNSGIYMIEIIDKNNVSSIHKIIKTK